MITTAPAGARWRAAAASVVLVASGAWGGCISAPNLFTVDAPNDAGEDAVPAAQDGSAEAAPAADALPDEAAQLACIAVCPALGGTCEAGTCVLACPGIASCATGVACPP